MNFQVDVTYNHIIVRITENKKRLKPYHSRVLIWRLWTQR